MNKIRKGDQVIVLTGRDKGKRGTVTQRVDETACSSTASTSSRSTSSRTR
jgi:ribosomal protein L14E/L6E/L27E